jgi:GDSL-like Lipase/Acylhydrolase family
MKRRRWHPLCTPALAAVLVFGAAGCTGDEHSAAPAHEAVGKPQLYIALGGDDVSGGRRRPTDSWPQQLFRTALPTDATLVNLGSPRQGAEEIRRDQVGVAVRFRPDLVTITLLDDLERGTSPSALQENLGAIVRALHQVQGVTVLIGTAPPDVGTTAERAAFDAAIVAAARATGATVVNLGTVRSGDPARQRREIADAFGQALGSP